MILLERGFSLTSPRRIVLSLVYSTASPDRTLTPLAILSTLA